MSVICPGAMSQAWERFTSGIRSPATLGLYQYRMKTFLDYVKMSDSEFSKLAPKKAEDTVSKYISYLKDRVSKEEIAPATVRPCISPIQLFAVMNRMRLDWKYVLKQVPPSRKYGDDRAPTLEEIRRFLLHAPLRIKAAVLMMVSGGFRVGAFGYLNVGDVTELQGGLAKVRVYRGEPEEYFTFITPEANKAFKEYLAFRTAHGEIVTPKSPAMRDVFDSRGGKGRAREARRIPIFTLERDIVRLWHKCGTRVEAKRRHEFKAAHGFRKFFKIQCEQAGMKSLDVEVLMGHSVGVSNSYYKVTEAELLADYRKAVANLSVGEEYHVRSELEEEFQAERERFETEKAGWERRFMDLAKTVEGLEQKVASKRGTPGSAGPKQGV